MVIDDYKTPPTWVRQIAASQTENADAVESIEMELQNAIKPQLEEPATVHPFNTSISKIRNNGMIDNFVGTDCGTRTDPYTKTINEITNVYKWHLGYFKGWIDNDASWYAKMNFLFQSEEGNFNVKAKKDITMECEGNMTFTCKGKVTINTEEFSINGKGINLDMTEGNADFKGSGTKSKSGTNIISSASPALTINGEAVARLGDSVDVEHPEGN